MKIALPGLVLSVTGCLIARPPLISARLSQMRIGGFRGMIGHVRDFLEKSRSLNLVSGFLRGAWTKVVLMRPESCIQTILRQQGVMIAAFGNFAFIQHNNFLCINNRG
jgi:hypothetical protein